MADHVAKSGQQPSKRNAVGPALEPQPTAQASSQPAHLQRSVPVGRNTLRHEVNRHPSGWEMHRVTVPKRINSTNRVEGDKIIKNVVDHARGQGRRLDATVWADIVRKDGNGVDYTVCKLPDGTMIDAEEFYKTGGDLSKFKSVNR